METTINASTLAAPVNRLPAINPIRLAGIIFICVCIPLAMWGIGYVPSKIFVAQDPAATSANLLSNEFIFRTSIISHLASTVFFVWMILLFHRALQGFNATVSQAMLIAACAQIPIVLITEAMRFGALMILESEPRAAFDLVQKQETVYVLLRIAKYGVGIAQIFFGLCFIPLGILVIRSRVAPTIVGILVIVTGIGYVADCCTYVLLQRLDFAVVRPYIIYSFIGFPLAMFWFLVRGGKQNTNSDDER